MSIQILPQTPNDILLWDDGVWCYAHELHIKGRRKEEPRRIPSRTSEWYSHIMGIPKHRRPLCEIENLK